MIGAMIGDIVGSRFEFNNTNDLHFELFTEECSFTDDSICTLAIGYALVNGISYEESLRSWCAMYPTPMGSYGGSFARWLASDNPQPYNSFGNGSAMRVSPVAWWFDNLEDVQREAEKTALPTHNHPEGIKGAVATATAIFLARKYGKEVMLAAMKEFYPQWVEPLFGRNKFDETCQGTMPVVFGIINEANNFGEAIRYAIAVGGDSDTIGAIVGSIAEAIYGIPKYISDCALSFLPPLMESNVVEFYKSLVQRQNGKG
jgi:ADP-ribosylglycohydrolase